MKSKIKQIHAIVFGLGITAFLLINSPKGVLALTIISPSGGDIVPSGSRQKIEISESGNSVRFRYFYSLNKGVTWNKAEMVGRTNYWKVPVTSRNFGACLIRVTGYNANGKKTEAALSEPFVIQLGSINSPVGEEKLVAGGAFAINWTTFATSEKVSKVHLYFSKNRAKTWAFISKSNKNPGTYMWQVPLVEQTKSDCQIRVDLKSSSGATIGTFKSQPFSIYPFGFSFSKPINLSNSEDMSLDPDFVFDKNGNVNVIWTESAGDLFFSRSTNNGESFSEPVMISTNDACNSVGSTIATDGEDRIAVYWNNGFTQSRDNGNSFSSPLFVAHGVGGNALAMTSDNIYVGFFEGDINDEVFIQRSTDGGLTFSAPLNISNSPEKSWMPKIAVDQEGIIYATWQEGSAFDDKRIFFSKSIDEGNSFSEPLLISPPLGDSFEQSITIGEEGRVYISWCAGISMFQNQESFLLYSDDGGDTFSDLVKIPVITPTDNCPNIVSMGTDKIGLIWTGQFCPLPITDPNYKKTDIYFSTGQLLFP